MQKDYYFNGEESPPSETDNLQINKPDSEVMTLKKRLLKNIIASNVAVFFQNVAMMVIFPTQSSLNSHQGMGVASLAVVNAFTVIGSYLSGTFIQWYGCKTVLVAGSALSSALYVANFFPLWTTLLPAALVTGIGMGLSKVSEQTYTAEIGRFYAATTNTDPEKVHSRFFAFAIIIFRTSAMVSSVATSIVLMKHDTKFINNEEQHKDYFKMCGASYCNEDISSYGTCQNCTFNDTTQSHSINQEQLYSLMSFCVLVRIIGFVVTLFFVESFAELGLEDKTVRNYDILTSITETIQQLKDRRLLLLLPMFTILGTHDSFYHADFSKAFITCSLGVQYLGMVSIWSGISGIMGSFLVGWFNTKQSRLFPMTLATIVQLGAILAMLNHEPNSNSFIMYCIITAAWFLGSGIRNTSIPALTAAVFSDNLAAAFSNLMVWTSLGSCAVFALNHQICTAEKLYAIGVLTVIGYVCYSILEIYLQKKNKQTDYGN